MVFPVTMEILRVKTYFWFAGWAAAAPYVSWFFLRCRFGDPSMQFGGCGFQSELLLAMTLLVEVLSMC